MSSERSRPGPRAWLALLLLVSALLGGQAFLGVARGGDGGGGKRSEGESRTQCPGGQRDRCDASELRVEAQGTASLAPVADAHVRRDRPSANFGAAERLRVDGDPSSNAYLRFDVDVPSGERVRRATLRVYANQSSRSGIAVHRVTDDSWDESQITWDNAPAIGERIRRSGAYSGGSYVSLTVTAVVQDSGSVSLALKPSSGRSNTFNSSEASAHPPQLVIETEPVASDTPSGSLLADAHVRADQPDSNFGSSASLRVDGDPRSNAYLRFAATVPDGQRVRRATLRLFTTQSSSSGIAVHRVTDNSWDESRITWSNAPTIGDRVGGSGGYSGNTYVSVDVTALITGTGPVSMAVTRSSTTSNSFSSGEAAANPPQLVVETEAVPPPGATVVYALGDGADGGPTARSLADYVRGQNPDRFFYLGDVYETGTAEEFAANYDPLYGAMASITDPVMGNHEYGNRSVGYYPYWAAKRGWTQEEAEHRAYVDRSGWQVIAYSSEAADKTAEASWVASQVAKHGGTCRIAMGHRGRHVVTDALQGDQTDQEPIWAALSGNTAINLVGHNHLSGRLEPLGGVTVIVSGAGGHSLRAPGVQHHPVAASKDGVATATRLILRPGAADLQQVDSTGTVHDSATIGCIPAA